MDFNDIVPWFTVAVSLLTAVCVFTGIVLNVLGNREIRRGWEELRKKLETLSSKLEGMDVRLGIICHRFTALMNMVANQRTLGDCDDHDKKGT